MLMIILLFTCHYLADWLLQSLKMGKEKSEKFIVLLQHISIHFVVFVVLVSLFYDVEKGLIIATLNAIIHGMVDWFIWRGYKMTVWKRRYLFLPESLNKPADNTKEETQQLLWLKENFRYWDDHTFSLFLGVDQFIHYVSLVLIWGMVS